MFLETYTTQTLDELKSKLPDFLAIVSDVTGQPTYSMYNLSLKEDWLNNSKFCHRLIGIMTVNVFLFFLVNEIFKCVIITNQLMTMKISRAVPEQTDGLDR